MALSSATKALLGEAASWIVAAGVCAAAFVHYDDLKHLAARAVGVSAPEQLTAVDDTQAAPAIEARSGGAVEIRAGENGHYSTEAEINGRRVAVLIDTGATMVALTYEDAETAGISLRPADFTHRVSTANGIARVAPVTLDRVSIGDLTVRNVQAAVAERGRLTTSLLGMSFLGRLTRVDMRSGVLVLQD
jgi:aspartyl protease family protein